MKFSNIKQIPRSTYKANIPIKNLLDNLEFLQTRCHLDLNPKFQREHKWTTKQKSEYVTYLLIGGVSGRDIYFNNPKWSGIIDKNSKTVLVDGKQRLSAIIDFLGGKFKVNVKDENGLEHSLFYSEFEDGIPLDITLVFNITEIEKQSEVVRWYIDFNSGGTPHSKEEIQKAEDYYNELVEQGK